MTRFELFKASIPRRLLTGWDQPISLLEQISCVTVYETSEFLDQNDIEHQMGWYGDPNPGYEEVGFRLLLDIPDHKAAVLFRLWANVEPIS